MLPYHNTFIIEHTIHKAIQMIIYQKRIWTWRKENSALWLLKLIWRKNLVGLGAGIKGILTPPLCCLDSCQSASAALCFEVRAISMRQCRLRWWAWLCIQNDQHNNVYTVYCVGSEQSSYPVWIYEYERLTWLVHLVLGLGYISAANIKGISSSLHFWHKHAKANEPLNLQLWDFVLLP